MIGYSKLRTVLNSQGGKTCTRQDCTRVFCATESFTTSCWSSSARRSTRSRETFSREKIRDLRPVTFFACLCHNECPVIPSLFFPAYPNLSLTGIDSSLSLAPWYAFVETRQWLIILLTYWPVWQGIHDRTTKQVGFISEKIVFHSNCQVELIFLNDFSKSLYPLLGYAVPAQA